MWKEVKLEGDTFEFKNEGDSVEGVYTSKQEDVGPNKSKMYSLDVDGKEVKVWGSTVLDNKFKQLEAEDYFEFDRTKIKITFLGMEKGKRGEYKNWRLEVWDKDEQVVKDSDIPVINVPEF